MRCDVVVVYRPKKNHPEIKSTLVQIAMMKFLNGFLSDYRIKRKYTKKKKKKKKCLMIAIGIDLLNAIKLSPNRQFGIRSSYYYLQTSQISFVFLFCFFVCFFWSSAPFGL